MMPGYIGIGVLLLVIIGFVIYTAIRNKEIQEKGIITNATVTRIVEQESTDSEGFSSTTQYIYYVTYTMQNGQTVEAKLASGKSIDNRIGKSWDDDLHQGSHVTIKYLPEKPNYVIRL